MKNVFSCLLVSFMLFAMNAKAAYPTIASNDNMIYAFSGSWYDQAQSGQGFDVVTYDIRDGHKYLVVYWYTFSVNGSEKIWLLAGGEITGNQALNLQVYQSTGGPNGNGNGYFNRNSPPGTTNKQVGTLTMTVSDCNTATIAWNFNGSFAATVAGGLGSGVDASGEVNVTRLTPATLVNGQDLCSTPLSAFDPTNNDSAYWEGQYNTCASDLASDEASIDTLLAQVNGLQEQAAEAYTNGYNDGYSDGDSDGYNSGYSDGDSAGYSDGYSSGYSDGYTDGYNDGSNSCDSGDLVSGKSSAKVAAHKAPTFAQVMAKAKAHTATIKVPSRSAQKAPFVPANKSAAQITQLVNKMSQELKALKAQMHSVKAAPKKTK